MKIGIISDAHIFNRCAISPDKYKDVIYDKFKGVDFIVDCGDLTDKSSLTAEQIDTLTNIFSNLNKKMYYVAGNHDSLGGTTVASIFDLKPNIEVIREPKVIDNMLFIPYIGNKTELFSKLDSLDLTDSLPLAFSHLNLTQNFYAMLPFNDDTAKQLHKYADVIFNGHIHTPESYKTLFGDIYNIGSCSSLTYGDEHIPCYSIYDTENKNLMHYTIEDTVVHYTCIIKDGLVPSSVYPDIDSLVTNHFVCCRFRLPNDCIGGLDLKKNVKHRFENNDRVELYFDYIKTQNSDTISVSVNKINKISLAEQLIKSFEKDMGVVLSDNIKKKVLN